MSKFKHYFPYFFPKEEGHHSDGVHKGPPNVHIIRHGHEWIHQSVADACRSLGEKTKGFCGDPTTLNLGNKYFGSFEKKKDYLNPSNFMTPPDKNLFRRKRRKEHSFQELDFDNSFIQKYTKPKKMRFNEPWKLEPLEKRYDSSKLKSFRFKPIDIKQMKNSLYKDNWLGNNTWLAKDSVKMDFVNVPTPTLSYVDHRSDPGYLDFKRGEAIVDGIIKRNAREVEMRDYKYGGIADYYNALTRSNMVEVRPVKLTEVRPLGLRPIPVPSPLRSWKP